MRYDANECPDPKIWSSLDQSARVDPVAAYHRQAQLPGGDELHIAVHVAINDHNGDVLLGIFGDVVAKAEVTSQRELARPANSSARSTPQPHSLMYEVRARTRPAATVPRAVRAVVRIATTKAPRLMKQKMRRRAKCTR
jgi:hypothetical protein